MNDWDRDYLIVQEIRKDDLRRAAQHRLVKEALAARKQNAGLEKHASTVSFRWSLGPLMLALARSLSLLADWMHVWSCRLQYRYQAANSLEAEPSPCG